MKCHERTAEVQAAHLKMTAAVMEIEREYGLTWGEIVAWHARELASAGKYMTRAERHPDDPDKPADVA